MVKDAVLCGLDGKVLVNADSARSATYQTAAVPRQGVGGKRDCANVLQAPAWLLADACREARCRVGAHQHQRNEEAGRQISRDAVGVHVRDLHFLGLVALADVSLNLKSINVAARKSASTSHPAPLRLRLLSTRPSEISKETE